MPPAKKERPCPARPDSKVPTIDFANQAITRRQPWLAKIGWLGIVLVLIEAWRLHAGMALAMGGILVAATLTWISWRHRRRARLFHRIPAINCTGPERLPVHGALRTFMDIALRRHTQLRDIDLQRMQRYGDIYLMFLGAMPIVVVTCSKLAERISTALDVFAKSDPRDLNMPFYYQWVGNNNVVLANGEAWRRIRRITHPPLNSVHLFSPVFQRKARLLCDGVASHLSKAGGAEIPLQRWLKAASLDSAGEALFGYDFRHLEQLRNPGIDALDYILGEVFNPVRRMLPVINRLPLPSNFRLQQSMALLDQLVMDMILAIRNQQIKAPQDHVLALLLRENADDHLSDEELRNNIIAMVLASHETTQVALGGVLYHLAKYPWWQQRIRKEAAEHFPDLDTAFGHLGNRESGSHSAAFKGLQSFHTLTHFILESMRIYSPLAHQNPRTTTRATELAGYQIPAGTLVSINIHAIHMNPREWEQPQQFDPERFSDESVQFRYAYLPFGAGPRICAGRLFSLMEQKIIICHLLRRFDIELPKADYVLPLERGSFTGMHEASFRLRFRQRANTED